MSEQSTPGPEHRPAKSGLKRTASAVGSGIGCLTFLIVLAFVAVGVLGIFLDDPAFWIAVAALTVAVAAFKVSKRGR